MLGEGRSGRERGGGGGGGASQVSYPVPAWMLSLKWGGLLVAHHRKGSFLPPSLPLLNFPFALLSFQACDF